MRLPVPGTQPTGMRIEYMEKQLFYSCYDYDIEKLYSVSHKYVSTQL